jgi:hypothetical protein
MFLFLTFIGCSPARISAPDDKPPLLAVVPASPATMTTLGVSAWKLYEGADRRVADGVTGADDIRVELDSSPQGFVFVDTAGNRITIDGRGTTALWSAAQQAGALLDADVRNQSDGDAPLLVCDAEAQALADTIQRAAMICQANPGTQACRDALHDIHRALHVLLDCILPPSTHHDGGVRDRDAGGDIGDGGSSAGDGGTACGGMDPHLVIFTGCSSQSYGRGAGDRCWHALDCQAVCCNCTGQSWSAAACIGGHCAGQADACTCLHDLAPQLCQ